MQIRKMLTLVTLLSTFSVYAQAADIQILSAVVKDQAISDATVIFQKNGEASVQGTTNAAGKVTLASPGGADSADVSMIVKKTGFSNLVVKCPCAGLSYAISPTLTNLDGLRIVLNWGSAPADLDSHLAYQDQHVYYSNKTGKDAHLDVDDVDGFGPETITLDRKQPGVKYLYAVHNFTDGQTKGSTALSSSSQAKVFVYIGDSLVRTFTPPKSKVGNVWVVFGIGANGEFYDINKFSDFKDRAAVGGFLTDLIKQGNFESIPEVTVDQKQLADSLNKDGERAYHQKKLDESIALYLQAINNNPEHGQAYSNLGLAYQKVGKRAEALWANRKAIALASGPNKATIQASSYFNIAKVYEEQGDWQDALENFKSAKGLKANAAYDKGIERMQKKTSGH